MNPVKLSLQIAELQKKVDELTELNRSLFLEKNSKNNVSNDWIPRKSAMIFFDYGDTQMTAIARKYNFTPSKIGAQTFYHRDSIAKALVDNIIK